ncbi:hypothetical protein GXW77_04125 [Roseomonas alkaliterrae]|uniref:Uncharacterized protein n=1 Tax=Neoroseomonas alkaliterrae TaxID=1452450 RepID=A0A840Y3G1_9PROT|nr:hypothetical protein [Neoroseomonas alkaliterrae]MBB5689172.1 hypothetical protein [Neoroseomonas alkaliterrae]MBR0675357.1 hypothetical protein [Neoroseomonas alkaliterrae]
MTSILAAMAALDARRPAERSRGGNEPSLRTAILAVALAALSAAGAGLSQPLP